MYNREKGYRVTLIKTDVSNDLQVKPKNNYDLTACTRFFASWELNGTFSQFSYDPRNTD